MAIPTSTWEERGQRAVGAAADLATGLFKGLRGIGGRVQAARFRPTVEALCASAGLIAAQQGRLKRAEIDGFRRFLQNNRQHPVIGQFQPDELLALFRDYAVKAFLEEDDAFTQVLDRVGTATDEANLIVLGCLSVVFADGQCSPQEREQIDSLAGRLGVNVDRLAQSVGVTLPAPLATYQPPAAIPAPMSTPAAPPAMSPPPAAPAPVMAPPPVAAPAPAAGRVPCGLCQGKGCVFCNQTGFTG